MRTRALTSASAIAVKQVKQQERYTRLKERLESPHYGTQAMSIMTNGHFSALPFHGRDRVTLN